MRLVDFVMALPGWLPGLLLVTYVSALSRELPSLAGLV